MAAEVSFLVAGISGAVVISVFSSELAGTFIIPRTVPATAVVITEPVAARISRQSGYAASHRHHSCPRPVIPLGRKLNNAQQKLSPILERVAKITAPFSRAKSRIFNKLGLACLFPKLTRPFEPILIYVRCKLGLENDGFMETPPCDTDACKEPTIEDQVITQDRGLPNLDFMIEGQVSTMDDCFDDMEKVTYGSRVQSKLVDDVSCDDPRYQAMCQEIENEGRVLEEENCISPRYLNSPHHIRL